MSSSFFDPRNRKRLTAISSIDPKDKEKLNADIYIFTNKVEDLQSDSRSLQHWILVVKFMHKTLYLDANNDNGKLVPYINYTEPKNIESKRFIASVKTSVEKVREFALNNPSNYRSYSALINNCQNWINIILKMLGLNQTCTVSEKVIFGGAVTSMIFGAPGLMMYGAAMFVLDAIASGSRSTSS
ncbi:UNVERIFIED_CONTAM: hypothetical protein RMT77_013025 [Armadillidium vulgare]